MAIGILGGTFNPIHIGHLILAQEVSVLMNLEKIIFIPAKVPPLKTDFLAPEHRYNMVKIAIENNPIFSLSDIEIKREGYSYTYDTIVELKKTSKENLVFIIGSDKILELPEWYKWELLLHECDFSIVNRIHHDSSLLDNLKNRIPSQIFQKMKQNFIEIPLIAISSTLIRNKCKKNQPIKYFVTHGVEKYIQEHNLYQND